MWALTPLTRDAEGRVGGVFPITDDLTLLLLMRLSPAVEAAGGRSSVERRRPLPHDEDPLGRLGRAGRILEGLPWDELAHQRAGTDAHKLEELSPRSHRRGEGRPEAHRHRRLLAPRRRHGRRGAPTHEDPRGPLRTTLRSAAGPRRPGMLGDRTTPFATAWRAAPKGDLLAVIPHLMRPWLRGDLDAWRRALPEAHAAFMALKAEAASDAREADEPVVVMFGAGTSATMTPKEAGLLSFIRRPKPVAPSFGSSTESRLDPHPHPTLRRARRGVAPAVRPLRPDRPRVAARGITCREDLEQEWKGLLSPRCSKAPAKRPSASRSRVSGRTRHHRRRLRLRRRHRLRGGPERPPARWGSPSTISSPTASLHGYGLTDALVDIIAG